MAAHHSPRRIERAGDAELVQLTRKGDTDAYAALFSRHATAAASVARSVTRTFEPDDLVSEAYTRILHALKSGNGPTGAFRPYLFTTVRNIAATWGRAGKDAVALAPEELDTLAVAEDDALIVLDRSLTAQAFRTLPPRWQEVLWYTEVEGMRPAEVAPLIGVGAQAAAALSYRAREGLRQAWIRAHLTSANLEPECAWTVERLAAHARGRLGKRERTRVDAHLETCAKCSLAAAEAREAGRRLVFVLLPLAIGASAATAYAATLKSGAAVGIAAAGAGVAGGVSAGASGTTGAAGSAPAAGAAGGAHAATGAAGSSGLFSGATGVVVGVAASLIVVGGAIAGVLVATADGHPSRGAAKVAANAERNAAPTPDPTGADAASPAASSPAPTGTPSGTPTPSASDPASPVNVPAQPAAPGEPPVASDPPATTDPPPVTVTPPAAPAITVDTADGRYYPIVSGTADPGAQVTVSGGGTTVTVHADASGAWRVSTAFTGYGTGTGTVTATQTSGDGIASAPASASFTLTAPQASIWQVGNAPIAFLTIVGTPDATVELLADDVSQGTRRINGNGQRHDTVLGGSRGHDIAVRYSDAAGRVGPSTHASLTPAG
ncbi:sigma-70 family RNA polymerase sigma factor [Rathayibacter sp. CAU 1779]